MYPATISYSYVEKKETVRHGRIHITYTYLGDMNFDIPFSEFAKRSSPDVSEMFSYIMTHCDEERFAEEFRKAGYGYRHLMAIAEQMLKEVA
ncbi:hypothetical protein XBP1_3040002 [Xenorhabdus bovienii str. puntauvense]|uniref:Uncharacterized protein n=1 Tax=Xenorhabdus bovienii str. puntauvense TaxID=1398201 RepID=A0A077NKK6_XENBV|nr:hypothetical protein [Xenorhabdus bovienii]CDG98430.1 hypothetical protein XBP1_3040002 [Xenorhabdus bovienii str. puntauvense]